MQKVTSILTKPGKLCCLNGKLHPSHNNNSIFNFSLDWNKISVEHGGNLQQGPIRANLLMYKLLHRSTSVMGGYLIKEFDQCE